MINQIKIITSIEQHLMNLIYRIHNLSFPLVHLVYTTNKSYIFHKLKLIIIQLFLHFSFLDYL